MLPCLSKYTMLLSLNFYNAAFAYILRMYKHAACGAELEEQYVTGMYRRGPASCLLYPVKNSSLLLPSAFSPLVPARCYEHS
jgi:hypothetical protein